ncbi:MAG: (d)CMP kinase [Candidatus Odinarchaeota archaeon]
MILSISGLHGTGKSTIGKLIAEKLGIRYYSTGQAFRDLAQDMNMSLEEFSKFVEKKPEIDKDLDNKIIKIAQEGNIIVDSQLSGHLLKSVADFKIMLICPLEIRVKRMAERDGTSYQQKLKETQIREKSELERFKHLYHIDLSDQKEFKKLYNIIINTEHLTIEQIIDKIILALEKKKVIAKF